jgi:2-dehydropantoate 2-reductase
MKIGIIGAGSIGLLYGGYLGKENAITMFPRGIDQSNLLRLEGITVMTEGGSFSTKVNSNVSAALINNQELIIITVKQYHLSEIMVVLERINPNIPLLFLQNGMGHIQMLKELPSKTIFVGTVEHGALRMNETTVKHNGIGKTNMAVFKGDKQQIESTHLASLPFFPFEFHIDWEKMLVKKLMTNALINPLTALLKVKNGQLLANSNYFSVFKAYYNEIHSIFSFMDKQAVFSEILKVCQNTKENESSMLSDIRNKRKTEIDAILGYIIDRSNVENIQIPITWSFYQMVKGMEEERGE